MTVHTKLSRFCFNVISNHHNILAHTAQRKTRHVERSFKTVLTLLCVSLDRATDYAGCLYMLAISTGIGGRFADPA